MIELNWLCAFVLENVYTGKKRKGGIKKAFDPPSIIL
jgi:hypothetical protein